MQGYSQEYDRWFIKKSNGKVGFINSSGNEIFSGKFDYLGENYYSGLVSFKKNSKWGYLDIFGKVAFMTNDCFGSFSENLLSVENNGNFYFLDTLGQKALALTELEIPNGKKIVKVCNFYCGLSLVILSDSFKDYNLTYGFIDKTGRWFIEPIFQHSTSFVEGVAYVVKDSIGYFMDTKGNFITQLDVKNGYISQDGDSDLFDFSEGFALVYFDTVTVNTSFSTSFINIKGERITTQRFERANKFSDGMASVQIDDKWGYIDTTGTIVIPPQYDWGCSYDFSEGLAQVCLKIEESRYGFSSYSIRGFIDKTGATVIPFQPEVIYSSKGFRNGIIQGKRSIYENSRYTGKYEFFYMNKKSEKIWSEIVKQ